MSTRFSDERLESMLFELADSIDYPDTPQLASAVKQQIEAEPVRPRRKAWNWRPALVAAAVVLIAVIGTLTLSPQAREAVADFLGIGGVRIGYGDRAPAPVRDLDLGPRTTIAAAEKRLGFAVLTPQIGGLGEPSVHVTEPPADGMVSVFYPQAFPAQPGPPGHPVERALLITQFRADVDGGFFKKIGADDVEITYTTVRGREAYWLEGAHYFLYLDEFGSLLEEKVRLAQNVLLWEENGITYRIEGLIGQDRALRIAESMR